MCVCYLSYIYQYNLLVLFVHLHTVCMYESVRKKRERERKEQKMWLVWLRSLAGWLALLDGWLREMRWLAGWRSLLVGSKYDTVRYDTVVS